MIKTYVRLMPAAYHDHCANCSQEYIPGDMIYWHGRFAKGTQLSRASHQGCFWDDIKNGPAPHLTWEQLTALDGALSGFALPDAQNVRRLLGAVRTALGRRAESFYKGDKDAGLRMGPDLLEGYRVVLKAIGKTKETFWHPVESGGLVKWVNPDKKPTEQRPPADFARMFREKHA